MIISNNKFLINLLASDAQMFSGIKPSRSKKIATNFVHDGNIPVNDPFVNHGNIDSYVIEMLLKYHVLTKKQLLKKTKQFASI